MSLFGSIVKASLLDCLIFEDSVTFVIPDNDRELLDSVNEKALSELSRIVKRRIDVVFYSDDIFTFVKNIFFPVPIERVKLIENLGRKKVLQVRVPISKKGLAIGKDGSNIRRVKSILGKHFQIEDVRVV